MINRITQKEIQENLSNRLWRLNNLYVIKDQNGDMITFKLNDVQTELHKGLWFFTIIPKARQLGICLDPKTRVLTADLKWVAIGDLKIGEDIVSVDEYPKKKGKGQTRKMRTGKVEGVIRLKKEKYKIKFDDGRILICTGKHPWLSKKTNPQAQWMTIDGSGFHNRKNKLTVGTKIRWVTKPWGETTIEDGWFGGMLDGEGSCSNPKRPGVNVGISQRGGDVFDRMVKYVEERGYNYRIEKDARKGSDPSVSKFGDKTIYKVVFSRMAEVFRLFGQTRPTRFVNNRFWEGKEMPAFKEMGMGWATITSIEAIGSGEVIDLQTSLGTYIAEGFVSHNTTFFAILYFDQILFSRNKTANIIAHRQDDMKKIFKNKIRFAWDNMHPWVKEMIGEPKSDSAFEMTFPNGGSISVSLSSRSDTVQFLHISEFGYICSKYPEKAEEIVTGAINSVHAGNFVSIESTAMGRSGKFYEFCMIADRARKEGRKLTPIDFKLFFYPWWIDKRYVLDGAVIISQEEEKYFQDLEDNHNIILSKLQKNWYIKKKVLQGGKMFQEYPSTLEESFQVSLENAYYNKQMDNVFKQNRITKVPYDPLLSVDSWWDLGINDFNVILLTQSKGREIRFIDMYYNSGEGLKHYYEWLEKRRDIMGYRYGRHYFPFDVEVRELGSGQTRKQTLMKLGMRNIVVGVKSNRNDGIERVRNLFPYFWFDEVKCKKLYDALSNYRKEVDKKTGIAKDNPLHDENSHFADPVRLLAQKWKEYVPSLDGQDAGVQSRSFF